jgi:MFS family permease
LAGILAAAAYTMLAVTHLPLVAGAALALESVGLVLGNVAARALRQSTVPADLQGRVVSTYQMCTLGMIPLGSVAGGLLSEWIGIRPMFVFAALLQLVVLLALTPPLIARVRQQEAGPS